MIFVLKVSENNCLHSGLSNQSHAEPPWSISRCTWLMRKTDTSKNMRTKTACFINDSNLYPQQGYEPGGIKVQWARPSKSLLLLILWIEQWAKKKLPGEQTSTQMISHPIRCQDSEQARCWDGVCPRNTAGQMAGAERDNAYIPNISLISSPTQRFLNKLFKILCCPLRGVGTALKCKYL